MSDARWFEIDSAVEVAVRHFGGAVSIYAKLPAAQVTGDRYLIEMAFMHAKQSGRTSLRWMFWAWRRPLAQRYVWRGARLVGSSVIRRRGERVLKHG